MVTYDYQLVCICLNIDKGVVEMNDDFFSGVVVGMFLGFWGLVGMMYLIKG